MKYRLVLCDVDSTLIENEVIDLLATIAGKGDEVAQITAAAMRGELDFAGALRTRVSLLAGLPQSAISEVAELITYSSGAEALLDFCQSNSIQIGAVSGGFIEVIEEFGLSKRLDFVRANSLEIIDHKFSGGLVGPLIDRNAKAQALMDFAGSSGIALAETIAIGDGANDIEMVQLAGLGISFRGKSALDEVADLKIKTTLADVIPYLKG